MSISRRKVEHIKLVKKSYVPREYADERFIYEPLLSFHNKTFDPIMFLGKNIGGPIFLSSITGGSGKSKKINQIIASAAKEFKLPMGLGSLRPYLNNTHKDSFKIRNITGDNVSLFGNIGIAQIEEFLISKSSYRINDVINELQLDGLIIHINPLQEFVQQGGDKYTRSPLDTLNEFLPSINTKIIIKEVGAGFGLKSIEELLKLPIDILDFGAFGGTNFTKLELLRGNKQRFDTLSPLINIGQTPDYMIENINSLLLKNIGSEKQFIISGGIKNFLDSYYYNNKLNAFSIAGYAANILKHAKKSEKDLYNYLNLELEGYNFAQKFLQIK